MSLNSKLFVWQNKKKFAFKRFSVLAVMVISCNLLAGIAYFATNPLKPSVLGVVSGKDGYKLRFSKTTNGALTFTGNSLCLSDTQPQGTCGTFTTTNTNLTDSPYGAGTTSDWSKNSSKTVLKLPENSSVLYAELIWGGSYKYKDVDLTNVLDSSVNLQTPKGTYQIKPDSTTAAEVSESSAYVRTANVTDLISKDGSGNYILGAVPATMDRTNPYNNYAGWTLAVAYRDINQPARNLSIFVGSEQAGPDQFYNLAEVKGFATPTSGNISGRLLVSAQEGDPCNSGDQMRFGQTKTNLTALSGPNNKVNNFFASQINGDDGKLNTSGSFGSNNQSTSTCANNKRQGWDVTNVDISSLLKPNQTTAYAQGSSQGDVYMINGLGVQIDVNSAKPVINLAVDKAEAKVGDILTYTSKITNTGTTDSLNSNLNGLIPEGTSFVPESLTLDGQSKSNPNSNVNLGTIKPNQTYTVTYQVKVDSIPATQKFVNQTNLDYQYNMVTGEPSISDSTKSNEVVTTYSAKPNLPPVALDDSSSTDFETPVTIDILSNDSDPDGNLAPASLSVTTNPKNGTVTPANDKLIYSPKTGFTGTDTFEYQICDTSNLCDKALVTVVVKDKVAEILPPKASDDSSTTDINNPVTIDILKNDIFNDGKPESAVLSIISNPNNGKVSINKDGKVVYTPNTDFTGGDNFEYKLCDLTTLCTSAKVNVTIKPATVVNQPPVAIDDSATTPKNTPVTIDVLKNDSDADGNLNPSSLIIKTQPENGTLDLINNQVKYIPKDGFTGNDTFTYQICDSANLCSQAKVTVSITAPTEPTQPNPVVDSSIIAVDDLSTTQVNKPVIIPVLNNDSTTTQIVKSGVTISTLPTNGAAIPNSDGTITYTPTKDYNGDDSFVYQVCNTEQKCTKAKVSVKIDKGTVIPIIEYPKPIAINDKAQTTPNTRVTIPVSSNDSAPNDKLDLSSIKITQNAKNGTVISNQQNGNIDFIPNAGFVGQDSFKYTICNSNNQCAEATVTVDIQDRTGTETVVKPSIDPNPITTQAGTTIEPQAQTNKSEPAVAGVNDSNPVADVSDAPVVADKQSDTSDLGASKSKGQVLGVFENNQLIRTGGEYGFRILLPLNLVLILIIFALNRLTDKKEDAVVQMYE